MLRHLKIIFLFIQIIISVSVLSQTEYSSSEEMLAAANDLFSEEEYTQAFPLYSQLLSLDRTNSDLNYHFGVCLLYSDRSDTYAPIEYLNKALKEVSDPDIYYHLGFAYHINYNFPAAISFYKDYLNRVDHKNKAFDVERKIEMCNNGMQLLQSVKDLFVLQKSEVNRQEFFRSYNLVDFGGRIIKKPENFRNKEDAKSKDKDFIFFNSKATEVYYSAYGKDNKDNKDLYRRTKLENGGWSEPMRLPSSINTPYDEDFAVMMPDGITLYFSSKGHNTIGGYDIFKSVFDDISRTWSTPENINFPFNTPVDDILFISDSTESAAWFASVRNSVDDKIMVYKVGIIKRPEGSNDLAAIYAKNRNLSEADLGTIKDRAKLDVNISEEEYEEIPLIVDDPITDAKSISQSGEELMAIQLKQKEAEQQLIDSASSLINKIEQNIHSFESAQLLALDQAANKKSESSKLKNEVVKNLKHTQETDNLESLKEIVAASNILMGEAERLDYEVIELENFARQSQEQIDEQRRVFNQLNQQYGDAERAIINGNQKDAELILDEMQKVWEDIYKSSDQNAEMAKEEISSESIQYPQELENVSEFKAFAIGDTANETKHVEAFDSRFEVYLPIRSISDAKVEETGFSKDPFKKVEEYLTVLKEKSKNIKAQIAENEINQSELIESFEELEASRKEGQLALINQKAKEKVTLQTELNWVTQSAEELGNVYAPQNSETENQLDREKELQVMTQELEDTFDFTNKTFAIDPKPTLAFTATTYVMDNEGNIELTTAKENNVLYEKVLTTSDSDVKLLEQSSSMLEEVQKASQQNDNEIEKVQGKEDELKSSAKIAFNRANENISIAKSSNFSIKEEYLVQANQQFGLVHQYSDQIASYQTAQEDLTKASLESKILLDRMTSQMGQLEEAVTSNDRELIAQLNESIAADYKEFQNINERINEIKQQIAEVDNPISKAATPMNVYVIAENGNIIKNIGYNQQEWTSIDEFEQDVKIGNPENLVFPLDSDVNFVARNEQTLSNNYPEIDKDYQPIFFKENARLSGYSQSEFEMVQSAAEQILFIEKKTKELIRERNQLYSYYQEKAQEAKEMEQMSFEALQEESIHITNLNKANQLSFDSKKSLFEASAVAWILQEYDQKILNNTELLESSLSTFDQMSRYLTQNNNDEAININDVLLQEIAKLNENEMQNQAFDFSNNELLIDYPEAFNDDLVIEYQIIDGQVKQLKIAEQSTYINFPETNGVVDVFSSPLIITESEHIAASQTSVEDSTNIADSLMEEAPGNDSELALIQDNNLDVSTASENEIRTSIQTSYQIAKDHMNKVNFLGVSLTNAAEQKIIKSNEFSLSLESISDPEERKTIQDSSKYYLYQALGMKAVIEEYQHYVDAEKIKEEKMANYALNIDTQYNLRNEKKAKEFYQEWETEGVSFNIQPEKVLLEIRDSLSLQSQAIKIEMDSAFEMSQEKANESVKLISEASEMRAKAQAKKSAFKRRNLLNEADAKEQAAAQFQTESENALELGNMLYHQGLSYGALLDMDADFMETQMNELGSSVAANREVVFENIESRKGDILNEQLNTAIEEDIPIVQNATILQDDDLHTYERENFKAEMLTEELELVKREIALLLQTENSQITPNEKDLIKLKVNELRSKADSLEYEANKAFELANSILNTLSEEEQKEARRSSRDFNAYLGDLKDKIEILLSEANSYKQRAQRTDNTDTRNELLEQARSNEEVAIYLILEEFEVIAQKNKTRYRKNQLVLEQMLLDRASPQERELMRNIFAQIDDYFEQARLKREKANEKNISFNIKKILLQDAYSLEMKALDLQIKAKSMLENNDIDAMMVYQPNPVKEEFALTQQNQNGQETGMLMDNNAIEEMGTITVSNQYDSNQDEVVEVSDVSQEGLVYKVQIAAIREFVPNSYFNGVTDITAELVTGTDFIRYFSGEFSDLDDAIIRRNSLRVSGYPNAFIRSWRDGEGVSLLDIQDEDTQASTALSVGATNRTTINDVDFSATNIASLQGVYYTVQIGVYSRPRTSAMIFGIKPLYHKRMQNGYWVYYSGIYQTIADASVRKDEVVSQGVSDAFVVAFNNGQPTTLNEARQELSRGGAPPLDEDIVILEDASLQIENDWNLNQNPPISNIRNDGFKVQIGVYSNLINLDWIASQLDGNYRVDSYQSSNGKYIYTIGEFSQESEARSILNEVQELVPDAFIVSFENGIKKYIGN